MTATDLADAVTLYKAAGRAALEAQAEFAHWYQVNVEFADWDSAETIMAAHLGPRLRAAETDETISSWWFIRKAPCWRLRFHPGTTGLAATKRFVADALDTMTRHGPVTWRPSIYEPETCAFGGPDAISTAHHLFHSDSNNILDYLSRTASPATEPGIGRRELSILLCSALLRAAGQDWHEQGDVWHRVTRMRPLPPGTPPDRLRHMSSQIHHLLSLDTRGNLWSFAGWFAAFTHTGHLLGAAAHEGTLHRGIRDILAHHVIFHWNRLGLSARTQSVLAMAAFDAILDARPLPDAGTDVAKA